MCKKEVTQTVKHWKEFKKITLTITEWKSNHVVFTISLSKKSFFELKLCQINPNFAKSHLLE